MTATIRSMFPAVAEYVDQVDDLTAMVQEDREHSLITLRRYSREQLLGRAKTIFDLGSKYYSKPDLVEDLAEHDANHGSWGRALKRLQENADADLLALQAFWYEIRSTRQSLTSSATRLAQDTTAMLEALETGFVREPNVSKDAADVDKYAALLQYQAGKARDLVQGNEALVTYLVNAVATGAGGYFAFNHRTVAGLLREEDARLAQDAANVAAALATSTTA